MTKLILTFAALFAAATGIFGQTATPTPKPQDDSDVVKISTNLIQLDVTVTDNKGRIVTDLKPEDFEIYENGQKQKIIQFLIRLVGPRNDRKACRRRQGRDPAAAVAAAAGKDTANGRSGG